MSVDVATVMANVDHLVKELSVPNTKVFQSADEQFFDAFCGVTAYRNEDFVFMLEDEFIHHPEYDKVILGVCAAFNNDVQLFCETMDLPLVIGK